jgi:chromosome segregation ATPase
VAAAKVADAQKAEEEAKKQAKALRLQMKKLNADKAELERQLREARSQLDIAQQHAGNLTQVGVRVCVG